MNYRRLIIMKFMRRELMLLLATITDYDDDVKIHLNKS